MDLKLVAIFVLFSGLLLFGTILAYLDPILDIEGNVAGYRRIWIPCVVFLLSTVSGIGILHVRTALQPPLRQVVAPVFLNFKGCFPPYLDGDPRLVASACIDYHYKLDEDYAYRIGLSPDGSRGDSWYRIGNDAFLVNCGYGCRILKHEQAVFYQPAGPALR